MAILNADDKMKTLINEGARIGYSDTSFDNMIGKFNLSRLPDYENQTEPYIGYILMTRPDIDLSDQNLKAMRSNAQTAAFINDGRGLALMKAISSKASSAFVPLVTLRAKSYSVNDIDIKTIEKGGTYFGHMIKYGKHSEEHKIGSTISIEFRNDRYLSILKMMYLWMTYIYQVSKNDSLQPKLVYQHNGILDYCGSMYYLVTRRDGRELVYWEKLVGIFPIKAPFSIFTYTDNHILEDSFSVEFTYGIKADPCDPTILMDINVAHGVTSAQGGDIMRGVTYNKKTINMVNHESPFVKGDVLASKPYIHAVMQGGILKYYLDWI